MTIDFDKPTNSDSYLVVPSGIRDNVAAVAKMQQSGLVNPPNGFCAFNSSTKRLEENTGTPGSPTWTLHPVHQILAERAQVQNGAYNFKVATGSANAYIITFDTFPDSLIPAAYVEGQIFTFKANFTNTGSATLKVGPLLAKTIKTASGFTLVAGEIQSGAYVTVIFNGTDFIIISRAPNDKIAYTPTIGANGSMTWTLGTIHKAGFHTRDNQVLVDFDIEATIGGTPNNTLTISLPVPCASFDHAGIVWLTRSGSEIGMVLADNTAIKLHRDALANYVTGSWRVKGQVVYTRV